VILQQLAKLPYPTKNTRCLKVVRPGRLEAKHTLKLLFLGVQRASVTTADKWAEHSIHCRHDNSCRKQTKVLDLYWRQPSTKESAFNQRQPLQGFDLGLKLTTQEYRSYRLHLYPPSPKQYINRAPPPLEILLFQHLHVFTLGPFTVSRAKGAYYYTLHSTRPPSNIKIIYPTFLDNLINVPPDMGIRGGSKTFYDAQLW
jgi:hypothetical protein